MSFKKVYVNYQHVPGDIRLQHIIWALLQQQIDVSPGDRTREHAALVVSAPRNVSPTDQYDGKNGVEPDHVCHRVKHLRTDRQHKSCW